MHVVIAPDSFKGTLTAAEAAERIAAGWLSVRPRDTVALRPMADGGEGTLDAFAAVPGSERVPVAVVDAVGRPRESSWLRLPDGTGVVELADACGIVGLEPLDPRGAHTTGFGMAIRAALGRGCRGCCWRWGAARRRTAARGCWWRWAPGCSTTSAAR